jgi:histidinol-phosphate aminotransferase
VPFVGPETLERRAGRPFRARLGANESVFGPSPSAIEAMERAARDAWMYGDPECLALREALAAHHGVAVANVVVGEGIDGLLGWLVRLLAGPGDAVVTSLGAYPTFAYHVTGYGADLHAVPYRGDREDPDALLARAAEVGAKLVYLANPDNPMGSWHPGERIEAMLDGLPGDAILVLDEAYADLAPGEALPRIDPDDPRVIRMRTFSKAHGLAGLRVGYALAAPDLISAFDRVRNHFGVGRLAQAGALAALRDTEWVEHIRAQVTQARARIGALAGRQGMTALPSATNFVAVDCGRDGAFSRAILDGLGRRGVFARMPGVAPLDRCIRISAGTAEDIELLQDSFPAAVDEAADLART